LAALPASGHSFVRAAAKLGIADCVAHCVTLTIPQSTEWQRVGDQIDAAFIFARSDFVIVDLDWRRLALSEEIAAKFIPLGPNPHPFRHSTLRPFRIFAPH
jgi:hypothetical protein